MCVWIIIFFIFHLKYAPFKLASKSSLFERAKAAGLDKAAEKLLHEPRCSLNFAQYVKRDADSGVESVEKVKEGIKNYLSHIFSKDIDVLESIQNLYDDFCCIVEKPLWKYNSIFFFVDWAAPITASKLKHRKIQKRPKQTKTTNHRQMANESIKMMTRANLKCTSSFKLTSIAFSHIKRWPLIAAKI